MSCPVHTSTESCRLSFRGKARLPLLCALTLALFLLTSCAVQDGLLSPEERLEAGGDLAIDNADPELLVVRGHRLAVLERGDPQGFPVFYAHGNPGSRRELLFYHRMAREHGIRMIAFDRPGFGESELVQPYGLQDFADDVAALAQLKNITRYGLIGWSSGAPLVIATNYYHAPQVAFTFAIAGYTDFSAYPQAVELMKERGFPGADWSENRPILFNSVVSAIRWADLKAPDRYLSTLKKDLPESDLKVLEPKTASDLFVRIQQDALLTGTEGSVQDLRTQWKAWGFPLAAVTAPVMIVQGSDDPFIPAEFAQHLAANLGNAVFFGVPGRGHLMPLTEGFQTCLFTAAHRWLATGAPVLPDWPGCETESPD
jgi:pimeloyl-ACP methyl ester carboxylesterase